MAIAMTQEPSSTLHRGFSAWWTEETEYLFQRIERWAALARGYNRLRSQRLSRGRLTMQESQEPRWNILSNKIVIEDPNWCPRFHNLRRSHRRKSRNDENCHINCCGTFNYQSSSNIDSNCLENYRYDHSIYFKTIGDIKSSKICKTCKNDNDDEDISFTNDEPIVWTTRNPNELFDELFDRNDRQSIGDDRHFNMDDCNLNMDDRNFTMDDHNLNVDDDDEDKGNEDFTKENGDDHHCVPDSPLSVKENEKTLDRECSTNESGKIHLIIDQISIDKEDDNNNYNENDNDDATQKMIRLQLAQLTATQTHLNSTIESTIKLMSPQRNFEGFKRIASKRKARRSLRNARQAPIIGDNNVMWPGVLLNYTKNAENAVSSPHRHHPVQVK